MRGGFTLVEIAVFSGIGLVVFLVVASLSTSGSRLFARTSHQVAVTVDARALLETLSDDARATYVWADPGDRLAVLYRFASGDAGLRLKKNVTQQHGASYPYGADAPTTSQWVDVRRVEYWTEPDGPGRSRVMRREAGGYLERVVDVASGRIASTFHPDSAVAVRDAGPTCLASHVKALEVVPLAMAPADPPRRPRLVRAGKQGTSIEDAVAIVLHYAAEQKDEGQTTPEGAIELTTKVWIAHREYELRFPGAYGSVDPRRWL